MSSLSPAMELVIALSALQTRLLKKIDLRLSAHGISFTELLVLYHLDNAPNKTLRRIDLAEAVGLSASGVTRLLGPMEKIKLVEKQANPRDARVSLVKLSRSGEQVCRDAMQSFQESADALLEPIAPQQLKELLQLCKTLN